MSMSESSVTNGALPAASPFWMSLFLPPLAWFCAIQGGWTIALLPVSIWFLFSGLDFCIGRNTNNADTEASERAILAHRIITVIWAPLQFVMLFG